MDFSPLFNTSILIQNTQFFFSFYLIFLPLPKLRKRYDDQSNIEDGDYGDDNNDFYGVKSNHLHFLSLYKLFSILFVTCQIKIIDL